MLSARLNRSVVSLSRSTRLLQHASFSTSSILLRQAAASYKSKRTKLPAHKRIQTPEEVFHSASNVDIENLKKEVSERSELRYITPNKYWISQVFPDIQLPKDFTFYDDSSNRLYMKQKLTEKFGEIQTNFKWKDVQYTEVAVGDVVDLSGNFEKGDLSVIIELPQNSDDPRYTLLNAYGEIQYVSRSKMGVRMPKVFPKSWFNNCVLEESKFWENLEVDEVIPIGKPKYKLEDVIDRNKIFESAIARSINSETAAKTYILPSLLSGLVSETLTDIVTKSWQVLPDINIKLEVLHNVLQSNEAPIQLSLYQLYNAVEITNIQTLIADFKSQKPDDINKGYKKLLNLVSSTLSIDNQYDSISLGKEVIGTADLDKAVDVTRFYGFILSLRKNNQLYSHDAFDKASSFVLALPLSRIVNFNGLVQTFKQNEKLYGKLAAFISKKLKNESIYDEESKRIIPYYNTFIEVLKLYCAGSIQNSVLESFVIKVMRYLPLYKDLDITSSCVYDLLLNTGAIANSDEPVKWADNATIPHSGVSVKSDSEQDYYNIITESEVKHFVDLNNDLHTGERKTFDDVVYCIDSKNPLEIDDGVSIKALSEKEFLVSTFVADPSSYLEPSSLIARIAFERGATLYLPSLSDTRAISLLPGGFSQTTQLGYFNRKTRVLKVTFKYNIETKKVVEIPDKEIVLFGTATRFVKIDYASVNKLLLDDPSAEKIVKSKINNTDITSEQVFEDLKNLSKVSHCLNRKAIENGRVSLFDQLNYKREIADISETNDKQIKLTFKELVNDEFAELDDENNVKSEELVSEIMVMANNIAGNYFTKHNIPAIYKIQLPLEMSENVKQFSDELVTKKNSSFKELTLYQEYLTKSTIAPFSARHEFLNIENYATITSPLRRFWDLVNHWQLSSFVCSGKPMFNQKQINYMALHLKYRDEINTKVTNKVAAFYTFKALKYLQENEKENGKYSFKAIVTKKPSESGLIEVMLLDYGVRCTLETSWYALSDDKSGIEASKILTKNIEIGDVLDDTYIKDIDLVEGSIVLKSKSI